MKIKISKKGLIGLSLVVGIAIILIIIFVFYSKQPEPEIVKAQEGGWCTAQAVGDCIGTCDENDDPPGGCSCILDNNNCVGPNYEPAFILYPRDYVPASCYWACDCYCAYIGPGGCPSDRCIRPTYIHYLGNYPEGGCMGFVTSTCNIDKNCAFSTTKCGPLPVGGLLCHRWKDWKNIYPDFDSGYIWHEVGDNEIFEQYLSTAIEPDPNATSAVCNNGYDDDCDGLIDCLAPGEVSPLTNFVSSGMEPECLCGPFFSIKRGSATLAKIDRDGTMVIEGGLFQDMTFEEPIGTDNFIIKQGGGSLAWVKGTDWSGDFYVYGTVFEDHDMASPAPGDGDFVINGPDGTPVAFVDSGTGNFYLKGSLHKQQDL